MMAKPRPPRPKMAAPAAENPTDGEAMPLSHAAAHALRDVAAHHDQTPREAAEYAIGLWHWLSGQLASGKRLWLADENGDGGQMVELPGRAS